MASKRERNYELCTALDLTKLGITLDKMIEDGTIDMDERLRYFAIAQSLLGLMRLANKRPSRRDS